MTQFKKGQSGNPEGKKPGTRNRTTGQIREAVRMFIDNNFDQIQRDFNKAGGKQRLTFILGLMRYVLPTAKEIDLSVDLKRLTDDQIDEIVKKLLDHE